MNTQKITADLLKILFGGKPSQSDVEFSGASWLPKSFWKDCWIIHVLGLGFRKSDKKMGSFPQKENVGNDSFTSKISNKIWQIDVSHMFYLRKIPPGPGINFTIFWFQPSHGCQLSKVTFWAVQRDPGWWRMVRSKGVTRWKVWRSPEVMINQRLLRFCDIL